MTTEDDMHATIRKLTEERNRLAAFCRQLIEDGPFSGVGFGGGDLQDLAVEHGLLIEEKYDPEKHGPNDVDAEPGDPWYVFAPILEEKP